MRADSGSWRAQVASWNARRRQTVQCAHPHG